MLEEIDLNKKISKDEYNNLIDDLELKISNLQRQAKALKIPIMIVFEGFGASGKGTLINQLIHSLDPRGFSVYTTNKPTEEEIMRPFLWRFWNKIPENDRIAIFDRSWYRRVLIDRLDKITTNNQLQTAYDEITSFEQQLTDDGMIIIKLFLYISKKEQKHRFENLQNSKETSWRVSKLDWEHYKKYDELLKYTNEMLEKTDTENAKWNIIEATDKKYANIKILSTVINAIEDAIEMKKNQPNKIINSKINLDENKFKVSILNGIDLNKTMEKDEYKKRLKLAQEKLSVLHNEIYRKRIPVIIAFEGWDASGKGGAIKRLTETLDPRGYQVNPTASPNDIEKAHHYLWRFWKTFPKNGHIGIYDRTWYGRVMVERIEGFCTENEWERAYKEINQMEQYLTNEGTIILKFWLHIDKDEQEKRFKERQENPEKQWKITNEDWRNREKWDEYLFVVDEMLLRTSTTYAPWIVIEANSKYYARIKILETVINVIENKLKNK